MATQGEQVESSHHAQRPCHNWRSVVMGTSYTDRVDCSQCVTVLEWGSLHPITYHQEKASHRHNGPGSILIHRVSNTGRTPTIHDPTAAHSAERSPYSKYTQGATSCKNNSEAVSGWTRRSLQEPFRCYMRQGGQAHGKATTDQPYWASNLPPHTANGVFAVM